MQNSVGSLLAVNDINMQLRALSDTLRTGPIVAEAANGGRRGKREEGWQSASENQIRPRCQE